MREADTIRERLKAGPDCLTPEQLALLASGELAAADRAPLESHLASCSRCFAEQAILESYESAAESPGERLPLAAIAAGLERQRAARWPSAPAARKPFRLPWFSLPPMRTWGLAAAALLVVVAVGVQVRSLREPGLPSGAEEQTVRSVRVQAIAPSGELSRVPDQFSWRTSARAERYRVTVRDVEGTRLWTGEAGTPLLTFPTELRARLLPGKTVTWEVEALAGGKTVGSSGPVRFVFRPEP